MGEATLPSTAVPLDGASHRGPQGVGDADWAVRWTSRSVLWGHPSGRPTHAPVSRPCGGRATPLLPPFRRPGSQPQGHC